jgi:hypothetical protein
MSTVGLRRTVVIWGRREPRDSAAPFHIPRVMLGNVRQAAFKLHGPWGERFGWKLIARNLVVLCSNCAYREPRRWESAVRVNSELLYTA